MADRNTIRRIARSFAMKREDIESLTDLLTRAKVHVYEETLRELAGNMNLTEPVALAGDVRAMLTIEARQHARGIAKTFNDDLAGEAARLSPLGETELRSSLRAWIDNRNAQRAPMIAVTETYGPYADALMAGFMQLGLDDELFDFGGHPDDSPPECDICAALVETSPHPLKTVIRIGSPHPFCRQLWRARTSVEKLRAKLSDRSVQLGAVHAGMINRDTLIQRAGSRAAAAKAIRSGRIPR